MISLFRSLGSNSWGPTDNRWYYPIVRPTASGEEVTPLSAMTVDTVWACTRVYAATIARLPLNLHRRTGNSNVIATGHQVHRIIHWEWNPNLSSFNARTAGVNQQINLGNTYAEIQRDVAGRAMALHQIHASRVKVFITDTETAKQMRVSVGEVAYRVKMEPGQPDVLISRGDMFHVPSVMSDNGIVGKGVVDHAMESIGMAIATERHGASYQKNAGTPSVAIIAGKAGRPEDMEYYRKTWMEVHGAPEKSGKPVMVPPGGDVRVLSFSPEAGQFLGTRQFNVKSIIRWYGVPNHMAGDLEHATYSNIEEQGRQFVDYTLMPVLTAWTQEIWRKLLTPSEQEQYYAKFNVNALLEGNSSARGELYKALYSVSAITSDEIREKEDMNPFGDEAGNARMVQKQYIPLERAVEEPEMEPMPQAPPPMEPDEDDQPDDDTEDALSGVMAAIERLSGTMRQPAEEYDWAGSVERSAMLQVEDAVRRLRTREAKALTRAAGKQPREFFTWLDDFYTDHEAAIGNELERPLSAVAHARRQYEPDTRAAEVARQLASESKEAVLQATELPEDEWEQFAARVADLSTQWAADIPATVAAITRRAEDGILAS